MTNTLLNPPELFPRYSNYSHAVEVRSGARLLFIRGLKVCKRPAESADTT